MQSFNIIKTMNVPLKKNDSKVKPPVHHDFHKLSIEDLCLRLNTSPCEGMNTMNIPELLSKYGKNLIKQQKSNLFIQIASHFFGGFCGILW